MKDMSVKELIVKCGVGWNDFKAELLRRFEVLEKEICICAAIIDETGYIWRGHRHADCISLVTESGRSYKESRQGFVTSKNRFVDRYEGYKLQIAAGIKSADGGYRGQRLFSEDLY